jgi:hypothetical protein
MVSHLYLKLLRTFSNKKYVLIAKFAFFIFVWLYIHFIIYKFLTKFMLQYAIDANDEDRENEGDLIMAASEVTPEAMSFLVRYGTGIICVSMKEEDL